MEQRRRLLGLSGTLLAIGLLVLALQAGGTTVAAQAGGFPAFIPMPGVSARGVAVDKTGDVYVSVEEIRSAVRYIQVRKLTPDGEQVFAVEVGRGTIGGL